MASGNVIMSFDVREFVPDTTTGTTSSTSDGQISFVSSGLAGAISFPGKVNSAAVAVRRFSDTASLSTGATVKLLVSDDVNNPIGQAYVVLGVSFGELAASPNYYSPTDTNVGTEATATVLMPATSGQTIEVSIAVTVANMLGCAANKWGTIRIRRLGANAADTGSTTGRLLVLGVSVTDT